MIDSEGTGFYQVRNEPHADDPKYADGWYWYDQGSEMLVGPFDTRAEAVTDFEQHFFAAGNRS